MAATYTPIASTTLATTAASVTFSAIPATYTDLVLRWSGRSNAAGAGYQNVKVTLNGLTSGTLTSQTWLQNLAGSASSNRWSTAYPGYFWWEFNTTSAGWTSNTFDSYEMYLPNYLSSTAKPSSLFGAAENNATSPYWMIASANLTSSTSAISSIEVAVTSGNSFIANSSFHLYGIKNS